MSLKKYKSLLFLGYHFFLNLIKKLPFLSAPFNQQNSFLEHYKQDHIFAVTSKERNQMPDFALCHSCRLCDTACPEWDITNPLSSPSYLVMGYSRSLPDFSHLKHTTLSCHDCQICESICPQHVPIRNILTFVTQHTSA